VTHKDRYLRQQLIRDIQEETGRDLVVYFTDTEGTDAQIDQGDDQHIYELLRHKKRVGTDLLLETNGGFTDPTEKICSILRRLAPDLRVIVPRRAKSNGTVIALCGVEILMSATSELGPIDPHIGGAPAEFIVSAEAQVSDPMIVQVARSFREQTRKLATNLLKTGMLSQSVGDVDTIVDKLASRSHYHSHGSVIDSQEAIALGLHVKELSSSDALWEKIWLLRAMYAYDCGRNGYAKLFEGELVSSAVLQSK
jgi:ClpP class serine protease